MYPNSLSLFFTLDDNFSFSFLLTHSSYYVKQMLPETLHGHCETVDIILILIMHS